VTQRAARLARPEPLPGLHSYLHPGQLFASAEPLAISTILGTCVAVCLWDEEQRVGGMNHFLLPHVVSGALASPRFGNIACHRLLERVLALGARQQNLVAKVFGGCTPAHATPSTRNLGARNVELAIEVMRSERIPLVARDVGGPTGRKIVFDLADGAVWVRPIGPAPSRVKEFP